MFFTLNEIKNLTEEKVNSLKENQVAEDKHLEYKLTLPGERYEEKKEFLADISSFANADGGVIIYGIEAKDGVPEDIPGVEIENTDAVILRLENLLRTSIEPRIIGTYFQPLKLSNGRFLIIAYIPKSFNPPHVVNYQGHWRFYIRHSAGKHQMDLSEVKNSINLSENLGERIKNFRLDRISRIISNDVNIPLVESPKIVLHLLPLISFEKRYRIDLNIDISQNLRPLFDSTSYQRYNLDGLMTYSTIGDFKTADAYLLLYYNGIIETFNSRVLNVSSRDQKAFTVEAIERGLIDELTRLLGELNSLNVNCPIIIMITLLGVKGYLMDSSIAFIHANDSIDRDTVFLPEVMLNDYSEKIELVIKPIFDSLWQAFGFSKCRHYNDKGEWMLK